MKEKRTSESAFFNLRASVTLLVCGAAVSSMLSGVLLAFFHPEAPASSSQRTLTFADRVAYQRAIEEVYWRHRIWPKSRADSKPSLDAVISQAKIEEKVQDYLRKSEALEDYWQRLITPDQLQAEIERIASHTKQPGVLRELFAALGNDPVVIAECLARPVLAERLLTELYNEDRVRLTKVTWRKQPLKSWVAKGETQVPVTMTAVKANYTLPMIAGPSSICPDDTWTPTSITNAPDARNLHTAVWTGSEMIVWGGHSSHIGRDLNTGARYNPSTDSWMATSVAGAPDARYFHTAVWTGSEMIIWGGVSSGTYLNTGGRYNPSTDSWTATSLTNVPDARYLHTAVWTGSEMIIWGGSNGSYLDTGGKYNPGTDAWAATSTTNVPTGRERHTAVWSGNEMIVWGGFEGFNTLNTGGRYNPGADSWAATSTTNAPTRREYHTALWTGTEMIVWGGESAASGDLNTGGRYNPGADSWMATSTTNAPSARAFHTAVWSGSEMIVWSGGSDSGNVSSTGGRYNPGTDSWMATSTTNAPGGRVNHTAVWNGREMIVWGGNVLSVPLNSGGRYCATAPSPTPTATQTPTPTATPTPCTGRCAPTPRPRPTPPPRP